jgi:hypothetical protein
MDNEPYVLILLNNTLSYTSGPTFQTENDLGQHKQRARDFDLLLGLAHLYAHYFDGHLRLGSEFSQCHVLRRFVCKDGRLREQLQYST